MAKFEAVYLPALPPQCTDPTRGGFQTRDDAWNYILSQLCDNCRKIEQSGESSSCAAEWIIDEEGEAQS